MPAPRNCPHKEMVAGIAASPHLRRAYDLPNLTTRSQGNPILNSASPAQASLSTDNSLRRGARPTYSTAWPEGSLLFRPILPDPKVKADRCSAALLGMFLNRVPLCLCRPESRLQPRRAFERSSLPAPRPGWPRKVPEEPFTACRGDRTFSHLPRFPAVAGPLARPGPPSRSPSHHAPVARVGKAKNLGASLWITGISGKRRGTFFEPRIRPAVGCRSVLPALPRPSA